MGGPRDLLTTTESGLFCERGGFYIDPWKPVARAVVTHAHSDHAVAGCETYLCAARGVGVLRARVGPSASIEGAAYGRGVDLGGVRVSLHPAGHVLGSAQVRLEAAGEPVWVVSGDYKTAPDPTCDAFEPVGCDVFLTESTFGLPIYRWSHADDIARGINAWWAQNAADGVTSVVLAYSLGKTQRVLSMLDARIGPIGLHGAAMRLDAAYREAGVRMPEVRHVDAASIKEIKGRGLVIAPQSVLGTPWMRRLGGKAGVSTAQVSGWMRVRGRRRWRASDRGFVLSDHADWDGLNAAIDATGATRVGVTHGSIAALARWLRERGKDAFVVPTRWEGETEGGVEGAHNGGRTGERDLQGEEARGLPERGPRVTGGAPSDLQDGGP